MLVDSSAKDDTRRDTFTAKHGCRQGLFCFMLRVILFYASSRMNSFIRFLLFWPCLCCMSEMLGFCWLLCPLREKEIERILGRGEDFSDFWLSCVCSQSRARFAAVVSFSKISYFAGRYLERELFLTHHCSEYLFIYFSRAFYVVCPLCCLLCWILTRTRTYSEFFF